MINMMHFSSFANTVLIPTNIPNGRTSYAIFSKRAVFFRINKIKTQPDINNYLEIHKLK